ncbi:MAG: flagellar basal body rod protein [Myxococcota bacterium]
MDALGIALSGMQSAGVRVAVSAHNLANLSTEDFRPQRAVQSSLAGGGAVARVQTSDRPAPPNVAREVVGQIQASVQYDASARVFAVGAEMKGSLIDLLG